MDAMAQGADAVRDEKIIIKTQPPVGAAATATASAQAPRDADGQADWAICCSGGGIRSATYCLGALQRLDQGGLVGRAGWILGVSGGSYIAASRALVAHDLEQRNAEDRRADDRHAYARGTPEEQNLRDNTRYIAPDAKTALVAILSLLLGATVTFLLAIAPVYAFGHAWGWLLRWQGVLTWPQGKASVSVTAVTWWLAPVIAAAITGALFVYWWATLSSGYPSRGTRRARWVGWAAAIAVGTALAMLAVPLLINWLYHSTGPIGTIVKFFGFSGTGTWSPAVLIGVVTAMAAVARTCQNQLAKLSAPARGGGASAGVSAKFWAMVRGQLTPWFASAVVIAVGAFATLLWVGSAARAGYGLSQLVPVLVALLIMLLTRLVADVNRTSLHDFYRWRLAEAFAITRSAVENEDKDRQQELLAAAAGTRLSGLGHDAVGHDALGHGGSPDLVIGTTANINANREVPPGRGGFSLTFDPYHVTLRGAPGRADKKVEARTADYEDLVGHTRSTLFDVVAISGAAFSPLMGVMTRGAYRILLTATNMRLGVWLPHPAVVRRAREHLAAEPQLGKTDRLWWHLLLWYVLPHPFWRRSRGAREKREARLWAHVLQLRENNTKEKGRPWHARLVAALWWRAMQPTLGMLWAEAVGHTSYRATWINVTDGGHYDNLGLVEALQRGARNIVVLDASGDRVGTWFTLGGAMALARADAGVEIDLDPTAMMSPNGSGRAPKLYNGEVVLPWAHGKFTRPNPRPEEASLPREGSIWVFKLGWWKKAPWDIRAYAAGHPTYPCEPTIQQLYDGREFEAYRELGASAVNAACVSGAKKGQPQLPVL